MGKNYFRIDGADKQTGEETYLVLQAESKPHAERLARKQGLLISSVRVAKPTDWEAAPASPAPAGAVAVAVAEALSADSSPGAGAAAGLAEPPEPAPELAPVVEKAPRSARAEANESAAESISTSTRAGTSTSAITVLLCCIGGALIVGGVLALTLALWPDDAIRNELQQIDFRLHELSQTLLGGALVLAGLIVLVLAAVMTRRPR